MYPKIPQLGELTDENQGVLVEHCARLAEESANDRAELDPIVEQCQNLVAWGDVKPPPDGKMIVHEIRASVVAIVDIQMQEPPRPKLEPVETGEPPTYYWGAPDAYAGRATLPPAMGGLGLPPECVAEWVDPYDPTEQLQPPQPLDPLVGEFLSATAVSKEAVPVLGPGQVRPDWIVAVDDRKVADFYQTVFDVIWNRSRVNQWLRDNAWYTCIRGTGFGLFEFDATEMKVLLKHIPFTQCYIDPSVSDVKDAAYVGFSLIYDANEARATYPALTDIIDAEATDGRPAQFGSAAPLFWSGQFDKDFKRPMVALHVFFLANSPIPLSEEEAFQSGAIHQTEVADEAFGNAAADQTGGYDAGGDDLDSGPGLSAVQSDPAGVPLQAGHGEAADAEALPSALPPTRTALIHPDTGEELTPPSYDESGYCRCHPNWPTRFGTRQVTIMSGPGGTRIVDDRESEFGSDGKPILHNINIPWPTPRPHGIGEPWSLKELQRGINMTLGSMVDHVDMLGHPVSSMSYSMYAVLGGSPEKARAKAGQIHLIPDDLYDKAQGKIETIQDPPPLSQGAAELLPNLKTTIQEQSGYTPTMRGIAPSAQASGKMVDLLQTAGASQMSFKAKRLSDMCERLSDLLLHEIIGMDVDALMKIVRQYPRHVVEVFKERGQQIEWDVTVDPQAGTSQSRQAKAQNAIALRGAGLITKKTAQEMANVDTRVEEQREDAEMQKQARMAQALAPQGAPPPRAA